MKILLSFPSVNRRAGVERVVCESANFLASRGHDVTALTGEVEPNCLAGNIKQLIVPRPKPWKVGLAHFNEQFAEVVSSKRQQFDAHGAFCTASPPGGVLWVQAVHKRWLEISSQTRNIWGRCRQTLNPFHYVALKLEQQMIGGRKYGKLLALTSEVAHDLQRFYSVPSKDIEILPNGVNPEEFKPASALEKKRARENLGLPLDQPVIVFVANEVYRKGFLPLLSAVSQISVNPPWILAVGKLGSRESWQKHLASLGLAQRVVFTGPTSFANVAFAAGDVFALPTTYEAWGLVIVEALASGLPVLTSRTAGAAVAIREGENGWLLDQPQDVDEIRTKLIEVLAGKLQNPGEISRSVEAYHWSKVLLTYEQYLEDARSAANRR